MSPTGEDRRYLRFPYSAEPPVLEETVRRLAEAWEAYAPSDSREHEAAHGRRVTPAEPVGAIGFHW